jgi:hypothetical protein
MCFRTIYLSVCQRDIHWQKIDLIRRIAVTVAREQQSSEARLNGSRVS